MKEKTLQYQKELFAQKTPYLQWLRQQKTQDTDTMVVSGKQINKLPFSSCMDCIKCFGEIKAEQIYLFVREGGTLTAYAEQKIAAHFLTSEENDRTLFVYADEDYTGSLQALYGIEEQCFDVAVTMPYQYCMEKGETYYRGLPWFKPDFSPDTLASFFYLGSVFAIRGDVILKIIGQYQNEIDIYELVYWIFQEALERHQSGKNTGIIHISEVLYTNGYQRQAQQIECSKKIQKLYQKEPKKEKVSIIILSKDHAELLKKCLETLIQYTEYENYEVIVVDNGSSPEQKQRILNRIDAHNNTDKKHKIFYYYQRQEFNFSALCNIGAQYANGRYLLFMNDDVQVMGTAEGRKWLDKMMVYAAKPYVGAVGAKLYYPSSLEEDCDRIQHVGITNMGIGPAHKLNGRKDTGCIYYGRNTQNYNMLAVTAACMLIKKYVFDTVGGFDASFPVAYNDVELCFRLYQQGYFSVQVNEAVLIHHESLSRGYDFSPEKQRRLQEEKERLYKKYPLFCAADPFYSPHLVQWKKDIDYNVNYLYACDKMAEPVLLTGQIAKHKSGKGISKIIQREYFREQLYQKNTTVGKVYDHITGRHRFILQIDGVEQNDIEVKITGWCVKRNQDNAGISRTIWLVEETKKLGTGTIYAFDLPPKLREDVAELFARDKNTEHVALSGINLLFAKQGLRSGKYRIGVLVDKKHMLYIQDQAGSLVFVKVEKDSQ
ncbi:MAG: glycosyltransferase [Lachnospiraceae bacterium]